MFYGTKCDVGYIRCTSKLQNKLNRKFSLQRDQIRDKLLFDDAGRHVDDALVELSLRCFYYSIDGADDGSYDNTDKYK